MQRELAAGSSIATAPSRSNPSTIAWPPRLMLLASPRAACRSCRAAPRDDSTSMQPASQVASVNATHAVTCSCGVNPK